MYMYISVLHNLIHKKHKLVQQQVCFLSIAITCLTSFKEIGKLRRTMCIKTLNNGVHIYEGGCLYSMEARGTRATTP